MTSRRPSTLLRLPAAALLVAFPAIAAAQFAPSPAPADDGDLVSFVPRPAAVFVEQTTAHPDLGNTLVILRLDDEEVERLRKTTGRTDVVAVGPDGHQVLFRDDAGEGDAEAGDFEFTGIAEFDFDELAERAAEDDDTSDRGHTRAVPVFEQRAIAGATNVEGFDFEAFLAGARVTLTRSLSFSSFSGGLQQGARTDDGLRVITDAAFVPGTNQFQDRVLMIRDPLVVADPTRTFDPCTGAGTQMGPWTFGHLASSMANQAASGINPSTFVETWLLEWTVNQNINGFPVPSRAAMQALINDWRAASGGGDLNLAIAPFRLLAINPRIDLRTTVGSVGGYGGTGSGAFLDAGEARFTFGIVLPQSYVQSRNQWILHDPLPNSNNCRATRFSVIFEYRVPKCECKDVRDWARAWRQLNSFVPGSVAYNTRLERLTRTFTDANRNPTRPNRNAIGQVRSNEISLQIPWEIREFQLRMMPWSLLLETTTADTPDDSFGPPANASPVFGQFVIDVQNGLAGPSVPLFYPLGSGNNFLGAHPQTINPGTTFWNAPNLVFPAHELTRHLVSLGTCNGCHARETDTIFQHIVSFTPLPAPLSGFLTGITVLDPVTGTPRDFDDLARRETDINAVARMVCGRFRPIRHHPFVIGPLRSDGTEMRSMSAAASEETDPNGAQLSLAPEDFLRVPIAQVH